MYVCIYIVKEYMLFLLSFFCSCMPALGLMSVKMIKMFVEYFVEKLGLNYFGEFGLYYYNKWYVIKSRNENTSTHIRKNILQINKQKYLVSFIYRNMY